MQEADRPAAKPRGREGKRGRLRPGARETGRPVVGDTAGPAVQNPHGGREGPGRGRRRGFRRRETEARARPGRGARGAAAAHVPPLRAPRPVSPPLRARRPPARGARSPPRLRHNSGRPVPASRAASNRQTRGARRVLGALSEQRPHALHRGRAMSGPPHPPAPAPRGRPGSPRPVQRWGTAGRSPPTEGDRNRTFPPGQGSVVRPNLFSRICYHSSMNVQSC